MEETERILRKFYRPYNEMLAKALQDESYLWAIHYGDKTLREQQLEREGKKSGSVDHVETGQAADPLSAGSVGRVNPHHPLGGSAPRREGR